MVVAHTLSAVGLGRRSADRTPVISSGRYCKTVCSTHPPSWSNHVHYRRENMWRSRVTGSHWFQAPNPWRHLSASLFATSKNMKRCRTWKKTHRARSPAIDTNYLSSISSRTRVFLTLHSLSPWQPRLALILCLSPSPRISAMIEAAVSQDISRPESRDCCWGAEEGGQKQLVVLGQSAYSFPPGDEAETWSSIASSVSRE